MSAAQAVVDEWRSNHLSSRYVDAVLGLLLVSGMVAGKCFISEGLTIFSLILKYQMK